MLGINKRLELIEYRLARIDKMLEDMQTVPKQVPSVKSVVVYKTKKDTGKIKYPAAIIKAMSGRYQTAEQIAKRIGSTKMSIHTYLKFMRKDGIEIMKRGHNPTEYKLAKGAKANG